MVSRCRGVNTRDQTRDQDAATRPEHHGTDEPGGAEWREIWGVDGDEGRRLRLPFGCS
jgi:hypothetical protein